VAVEVAEVAHGDKRSARCEGRRAAGGGREAPATLASSKGPGGRDAMERGDWH
jgi:hypothetical protein